MTDRVTLVSEKAAREYGRRCVAIGEERRNTVDLQDAMSHPRFKSRHHDFLDELANDYRQLKPLIERPPFATIKVGIHESNEVLRQALLSTGCGIDDFGRDIFRSIKVTTEIEEINLIRASNAELGYPNGCITKKTYEAGLNLGWELCSGEDPPQYLFQCGQNIDKWLMFAMEPIVGFTGISGVFGVTHDADGNLLVGDVSDPDYLWSGGCQWVFRCK